MMLFGFAGIAAIVGLIFAAVVLPESWCCPLKCGSDGFSAFSGIAHERPNRDAPGIRPSAQYWLPRRSDTPQR